MRRFFGSRGSISRVTIESQALKSNMLDDPSVRVVDVYVRLRMTDWDCPCLLILSASRVVVYLIRIGSASAKTYRSGSTD